MSISRKELWDKIANHALDSVDSKFTFTQRLARNNDWNVDFGSRVVEEYKKFIYLICISDATLTPSDEVDQAWHLHLTYTYDYWDRFCKHSIGQDIHHGPTKGGDHEDKKYRQCYARTLALYEKEFGCRPPADIWPNETVRFGNARYLKRIDTSDFFLIPKAHVRSTVIFSGIMALTGCALVGIETSETAEVLLIYTVLGLFFWWVYHRNKKKKGTGDGCGGSGCGNGISNDGDADGGSGCGGGGCGGD